MQNRNGHENSGNHDARLGSSESIGAYLRDNRLSRDISLEEVSESTGISTAVLQALEKDDREKLPAEVYIKAFYKKYAEYLGLDPEEIQIKIRQPDQNLKKAGRRSSFSTVVTIKGQEENLFVEILRRLFLPITILVLGVLLYWIYKNYLAPLNPLGVYQDHFPSLCSFPPLNRADLFC
jgi:cytoskeletal protein RodZ